MAKADFVEEIYVGGSFVTDKAEPNDFDCILVVEPETFAGDLRPFEYNLISKRMTRRFYGGDVFAVAAGSDDHERMLSFLQNTRDKSECGIVEIQL